MDFVLYLSHIQKDENVIIIHQMLFNAELGWICVCRPRNFIWFTVKEQSELVNLGNETRIAMVKLWLTRGK